MKDIREMIDRYLDERMSLDEEQEFFSYLRSRELPEEFREERSLILQMAAMQADTTLPPGIEERLSATIDALQEREETDIKRGISIVPLWRAAAIITIMLGGTFAAMWQKSYEEKYIIAQETDTFSTPEEALSCASNVLRDLTMAANITHDNATKIGKDIILLNNILNK